MSDDQDQEDLITYRDFAKLWILIERQDEHIKRQVEHIDALSQELSCAKVILTSVLYDKGEGALVVTPKGQASLENHSVLIERGPALFGQEKGPIPFGRKRFTQTITATLLQRKKTQVGAQVTKSMIHQDINIKTS